MEEVFRADRVFLRRRAGSDHRCQPTRRYPARLADALLAAPSRSSSQHRYVPPPANPLEHPRWLREVMCSPSRHWPRPDFAAENVGTHGALRRAARLGKPASTARNKTVSVSVPRRRDAQRPSFTPRAPGIASPGPSEATRSPSSRPSQELRLPDLPRSVADGRCPRPPRFPQASIQPGSHAPSDAAFEPAAR